MRFIKSVRTSVYLQQFILFLLLLNAVSIALLLFRIAATDSGRYWFMLWNLFLAWVSVPIVVVIGEQLRVLRWKSPKIILLSALWLLFLPNSFYVISDLIHLRASGEVSILYDALLLASFAVNGVIAGLISLFLMHHLLLKHLKVVYAHRIIGASIVLSGFAIYLGRTLRWNSWDVVANPTGLLFDVSDELINPLTHPQVLVTTLTFSAFIGALYGVVYTGHRLLKRT